LAHLAWSTSFAFLGKLCEKRRESSPENEVRKEKRRPGRTEREN